MASSSREKEKRARHAIHYGAHVERTAAQLEGGPSEPHPAVDKPLTIKVRPRDLLPGDYIGRIVGYENGVIEYRAEQMVSVSDLIAKQRQLVEATDDGDHYFTACHVVLGLLGEVIPKISLMDQYNLKEKLGVAEDILNGAITRYTDK